MPGPEQGWREGNLEKAYKPTPARKAILPSHTQINDNVAVLAIPFFN